MEAATQAAIASKIDKAEQFQAMAEVAVDLESFDAACSLAVSSAINASDAIIMRAGLPAPSGRDHRDAVTVLRKVAGTATSQQLSAVLGFKDKAQYQAVRCSASDAAEAMKRSSRLLNKSKGL